MEHRFQGIRIAGPRDLVELQSTKVNMDFYWIAYLNQKVLQAIAATGTGRLSHVRCGQDVEGGWLYLFPCKPDDYGAEKLEYNETERGAKVSLFLGLLPFDLDRQAGRNRSFDCSLRPVRKGGARYLALNVRTSELVPARRLKREQGPLSQ